VTRGGEDPRWREVADLETLLLAEEAELYLRLNVNRRRLAVVRAKLDRIAQQREVQEIDRLLGLP